MKYKVLLPTSGIGSRLGDFSLYTNKSLVKVGEKPAISHIIDVYDDEIEIVVLLGYFGEHVSSFLRMMYPHRRFSFVAVDNYDGPGSSLIYSILQAEKLIDCPFILHACDTLIPDSDIPQPDSNWLGGCKLESSSDYTSFGVSDKVITKVYEKGQKDFDFVFIGIAGVVDYKDFFEEAKRIYAERPHDSQLSNIHVHTKQIDKGVSFKYYQFPNWLDVGNIDKLKEAQNHFPVSRIVTLNKKSEVIYIVNDHVVKFFSDANIARKRVERAQILEGVVPKILGYNQNFYCYRYVQGHAFSSIVTPRLTDRLFTWAKQNLWKTVGGSPHFHSVCKTFYYDKTLERLNTFLQLYNVRDEEVVINDCIVPSVRNMLCSIDEDVLCGGNPSSFHGDFILDNIVYTHDDSFILVDWRQDFGGSMLGGDVYYDLGKMNCSFIFNQDIVDRGHFSFVEKEDKVIVDILVSSNLLDCQQVFRKFLTENAFDSKKVDIVSAIIWLNMAPLHDYPLSVFLYYFGRLKLFHALEKFYDRAK